MSDTQTSAQFLGEDFNSWARYACCSPADADKLIAWQAAVAALVGRLSEYAEHQAHCELQPGPVCTCGLDDLRRALPGGGEPTP